MSVEGTLNVCTMAAIAGSSAAAPALYYPYRLTALPVAPLGTPSVAFAGYPFSGLNASPGSAVMLSTSTTRVVFELSV